MSASQNCLKDVPNQFIADFGAAFTSAHSSREKGEALAKFFPHNSLERLPEKDLILEELDRCWRLSDSIPSNIHEMDLEAECLWRHEFLSIFQQIFCSISSCSEAIRVLWNVTTLACTIACKLFEHVLECQTQIEATFVQYCEEVMNLATASSRAVTFVLEVDDAIIEHAPVHVLEMCPFFSQVCCLSKRLKVPSTSEGNVLSMLPKALSLLSKASTTALQSSIKSCVTSESGHFLPAQFTFVTFAFYGFQEVGHAAVDQGLFAIVNICWKEVVNILTTMAKADTHIREQAARFCMHEKPVSNQLLPQSCNPWIRGGPCECIQSLWILSAKALSIGLQTASKLSTGIAEQSSDEERDAVKKDLQRSFLLAKFFQNHAIRVSLLFAEEIDDKIVGAMGGYVLLHSGLLCCSSMGSTPRLVASTLASVLGPTVFALLNNLLLSDKLQEAKKGKLIEACFRQELGQELSEVAAKVEDIIQLHAADVVVDVKYSGQLYVGTLLLQLSPCLNRHLIHQLQQHLHHLLNLASKDETYSTLLSEVVWPTESCTKLEAPENGPEDCGKRLCQRLDEGLKLFCCAVSATEKGHLQDEESRRTEAFHRFQAFLVHNFCHPHRLAASLVVSCWRFVLRLSGQQLLQQHASLVGSLLRAAVWKVQGIDRSDQHTGQQECWPKVDLSSRRCLAQLLHHVATSVSGVLMSVPVPTVMDALVKPLVSILASHGVLPPAAPHLRFTVPPPADASALLEASESLRLLLCHSLADRVVQQLPEAVPSLIRTCFSVAKHSMQTERDGDKAVAAHLMASIASIMTALGKIQSASRKESWDLPSPPSPRELAGFALSALSAAMPSSQDLPSLSEAKLILLEAAVDLLAALTMIEPSPSYFMPQEHDTIVQVMSAVARLQPPSAVEDGPSAEEVCASCKAGSMLYNVTCLLRALLDKGGCCGSTRGPSSRDATFLWCEEEAAIALVSSALASRAPAAEQEARELLNLFAEERGSKAQHEGAEVSCKLATTAHQLLALHSVNSADSGKASDGSMAKGRAPVLLLRSEAKKVARRAQEIEGTMEIIRNYKVDQRQPGSAQQRSADEDEAAGPHTTHDAEDIGEEGRLSEDEIGCQEADAVTAAANDFKRASVQFIKFLTKGGSIDGPAKKVLKRRLAGVGRALADVQAMLN